MYRQHNCQGTAVFHTTFSATASSYQTPTEGPALVGRATSCRPCSNACFSCARLCPGSTVCGRVNATAVPGRYRVHGRWDVFRAHVPTGQRSVPCFPPMPPPHATVYEEYRTRNTVPLSICRTGDPPAHQHTTGNNTLHTLQCTSTVKRTGHHRPGWDGDNTTARQHDGGGTTARRGREVGRACDP